MITQNPYEMMLGFVLLNAAIVLLVYGVREIIILKQAYKRAQEGVSHNPPNFLNGRLNAGEFSKSEYDDLRLYALNHQFAHGEISKSKYEDLHHGIVH